MGLVDYSDSDSDSEPVQQKPVAPATTSTSSATTKKPFQKLLDKGKIVVNLPTASASADTADDDQPPAKRAKTAAGAGSSSSRFSSFGSFLPPPKKAGALATSNATASSSRPAGSAPARGINLKTGAEPAFIRSNRGDTSFEDDTTTTEGGNAGTTSSSTSTFSSSLNLPPPRKAPSIPEGQKPEEEVKLVGKPLMFKPLSVTRKKATPVSKKKAKLVASTTGTTTTAPAQTPTPQSQPKKQISLFSMDDNDNDTTNQSNSIPPPSTGTYEPLFTAPDPSPGYVQDDYTDSYPPPQQQQQQPPSQFNDPQSLSSIADSLSLSAAARRELFGRGGDKSSSAQVPANAKVVTFNMEQEYAHNEALRASGEQQVYNPVRSIAPGKHSLRQVVNMAQNQLEALEESFAQGRNNKRDAAGRYGWK